MTTWHWYQRHARSHHEPAAAATPFWQTLALGLTTVLFGIAAYYLPTVMLAVGRVSTILAAIIAAVFMVAIFVVFWLRGRSQRKKDH